MASVVPPIHSISDHIAFLFHLDIVSLYIKPGTVSSSPGNFYASFK